MVELRQTKQKLLEESTPRSKLCFLIPVFIAALIIGFFIEVIFFQRMSFQKLTDKFRDTYLISQSQYESEDAIYNMVKQQENLNNNNKGWSLIWKDDHTLLDIENFSFLINNQSICVENDDNNNILLILVASERNHFTERKTIRETYGSLLKLEDNSIRVVFLLGLNPEIQINANPFDLENETMKSLVEKENSLIGEENELISTENLLYGDMVVGNFVESQTFQNSYRHIMGYKWVLNFCPNARYVFNVDDNIFVNLHNLLSQNKFSFDTDFFCKIFHLSPANCVLCLDLGKYPKFCSGRFYGVNVEWIYKIYSVSHRYPLLQNDDVFVTGLLREKAERDFKVKATISENLRIRIHKKKTLCSAINSITNRTKSTESVIYLPRDERLTENFKCLWNKTEENHR